MFKYNDCDFRATDKFLIKPNLLIIKVTGLLGGSIYYKTADGSCNFRQETAFYMGTALMFSLTVLIILCTLSAALTYPFEIQIILREVFKLIFYLITRMIFNEKFFIF